MDDTDSGMIVPLDTTDDDVGQMPGKQLMGLVVVKTDGGRVRLGSAILR